MRKISDLVKDQNPLTLPGSTTVKKACESMRDRRVGAVLVTDEHGHLIGIFTGRDAVCRVSAEGKHPAKTTLADVMSREPRCMPPTSPAIDALRVMQDGGFRHVPVVSGGKVLGCVSHGDFRGLEHARLDEETGLWERL
jgi:CBS domain-containing protein